MSVPREEAAALLTIDLSALTRNWRAMAAMARRAECAAVVKADAYGIGLEPAGRALAAAGARTFFVAHVSEATRLRAAVPTATIFVLNGLFEAALDIYAARDLRPVLGSREDVERFSAFCRAIGRRLPAAIHVDTGMNRLGLDAAEAALLAEPGPQSFSFEPALLMSHFACADEPGHPLTRRQIDLFAQMRGLFPGVPGSLASSAGITLGDPARHDMVRPGVALYGGIFVDGMAPLEQVARLDAPIVQVRAVRVGESVGYGATWTASRDSRIAIVSVGYADGYHRIAGVKGDRPAAKVLVNGTRCPLAGRVSMDLIAIDVTDAGEVTRGTLVTLLGGGLSADEVAAPMGTVGYEVLTSLGRRYERRYVGG